jgi:hypothetical protein
MPAGITGLTQTAVAALFTAGEPVLEAKWHQPLSEPVRQKIAPQLAVALIASGLAYVEAAPFPETVTESRWHQPWSEPVRVKPRLPEGEQQFLSAQPWPAIAIGWYRPLEEPVRVKPGLRAQLQQVLAWQPAPSPFVATGWFNWLAEPVRRKPRLPEGEQQFFAFQPTPIVKIDWFGWLSEPARPRPPGRIPAHAQQFQPFAEDIIFVDRWFQWWPEPVRVRPALRVAGQQVLAFDPEPFPFLGGGGGWLLPADPSRTALDDGLPAPRKVRKPGGLREVEPQIAPPTFADVLAAQQPARLADVLGAAFAPRLATLAPPALDLYAPPFSGDASRTTLAEPSRAMAPAAIDAIADHVDALDAMEALHALDELERQEHEALIAIMLHHFASEGA